MNKKGAILFIVLLRVIFAPFHTLGQKLPPLQPEQDACHALQLCGNTFYTPYSYNGYGQIQEALVNFAGGYGCCSEDNAVWFKLIVTSRGTISFTIRPVNAADDYDFTIWDITNSNCSQLTAANMIRCNGVDNASSQPWGYTGLSSSALTTFEGPGPGIPYVRSINANPGDVYLLMVDNFSNSGAGFTIDFTGTTAGFAHPHVPLFDKVVPNCGMSQQMKVATTTRIACNSIAADGSNFRLTPGGSIGAAHGINCIGTTGNADTILLNFSPPLPAGNYVLHAQIGTNGTTLQNLCGDRQPLSDSIAFTVGPTDPPKMLEVIDTPACMMLNVRFNHNILCSSVAPDGSGFVVDGPCDVKIKRAVPIGCNNGTASVVNIAFAEPVFKPGKYTLKPVSNTTTAGITDTCGLSVVNSVSWWVSDKGYVTASATPNVLCEPGTILLTANAPTAPPRKIPGCGANGTEVCCTTPVAHFVGAGSGAFSSFTPFQFDNSRARILYKKSDLIAAGLCRGTITKLALNVTNKTSSDPLNQLTIKMACTTDTVITGTTFYGVGMEVVYTPKSYTTKPGTNIFTLDRTFDWDSTSLLIEICYGTPLPVIGQNFTDGVSCTPQAQPCVLYDHMLSGNNGCDLQTGFLATDRPDIAIVLAPEPQTEHVYAWQPGAYLTDTTAVWARINQSTLFMVTILDSNYCYRRDTANVIVSVRNPEVTGDTAVCKGDVIRLTANGGTHYEWIPATGLSCTNCAAPHAGPETTTAYNIIVTDQYGCADTLHTNVTVLPIPELIVSPHDTIVKVGDQVQLFASGGVQYLWTPPYGLDNTILSNPIATVTQPVIYAVHAWGDNGCSTSDSIRIDVDYRANLFVPNSFTPNGDGKNDIFRVANITSQKVIEFRIYNRWGAEVYSNAAGQGWDGTYNGVPQDIGDYHYLIRVAHADGKMDTYSGSVLLLR